MVFLFSRAPRVLKGWPFPDLSILARYVVFVAVSGAAKQIEFCLTLEGPMLNLIEASQSGILRAYKTNRQASAGLCYAGRKASVGMVRDEVAQFPARSEQDDGALAFWKLKFQVF